MFDDLSISPMVRHVLKFFKYEHLPSDLKVVSKKFADLALDLVQTIPEGPELTVCLRKLLEAKDCAVRSLLP